MSDDDTRTGSEIIIKEKNKVLEESLMSLRKLRESLLNHTADQFTKNVFLFSIRISARVSHYQTYIPSITYLLSNLNILNKSELNEIIQLYILHISHYTRDDKLALDLYFRYCPENLRLMEVMRALRVSDYRLWLKLYHNEKDIGYKQVMKFGLNRMVKLGIRVISKSYFQLAKSYIEDIFNLKFDVLKRDFECLWQLTERDMIVIRTR